jgi:dihydroorotase
LPPRAATAQPARPRCARARACRGGRGFTLKWGAAQKLPLAATLARITSEPARILRVGSGNLGAGAPGDVTLFDPAAEYRLGAETLKSQGKNTPFLGYALNGRVLYTIVAGNVVYEG